MKTIKEWLAKLSKQDGSYLAKDKLMQEIRRSNRLSFPVDYKDGDGVMIVAIPVPSNYRI